MNALLRLITVHGPPVALILICAACSVQVSAGGSDGGTESGSPIELDRVTTVQQACSSNTDELTPSRSQPVTAPIHRILVKTGELLVATDSALIRVSDEGREPILPAARDYALNGNTLYRLIGSRLERYRYGDGGPPQLLDSVPVESHERSIAATDEALFVHSAFYQHNHLVTRMDLTGGAASGQLLPVERSFLRLFLSGRIDRLLEDGGFLVGRADKLAFVPSIRNPIVIIDLAALELVEVRTLPDREGSVRLPEGEIEERREQECPTCTLQIDRTLRGAPIIEAIHAGAMLTDDALWVLAHREPGSVDAVLYRFALNPLPDTIQTQSWPLRGLTTPPRALAVHDGEAIVGTDSHLHWFPVPQTSPTCGDDTGASG